MKFWLTLLATALGMRLAIAFVILGGMDFASDPSSYRRIALELVHTGTFHKAFYYPPGLSYALAGFHIVLGDAVWVTRLACVLISTASVGVVVKLAQAVFANPTIAKWSGWIAAFYPPAVMMAGRPYPNPLTGLCLLLTVWLLIQAWHSGAIWRCALAGLAFGLACLTRPGTLSVLLALGIAVGYAAWHVHKNTGRTPWLPAPSRILTGFIVFCVVTAATLLPTLGHNHAYSAGFSLSINNERNLWLGNNPYTPLYKTSHLAERPKTALRPEVRIYMNEVTDGPNPREAMFNEAVSYIVSHPGLTLLRTINRFRAFWGFDYIMSREIQDRYGLRILGLTGLLLLEAGGYTIVMVFVLLHLTTHFRGGHFWLTVLILLVTSAYQLPYSIAFAAGTYHHAIMPLLMPFAAAGVVELRQAKTDKLFHAKAHPVFWIAVGLFLAIQLEYGIFAALMRG